jgi:hypothetical protein
MARLAVDGGVLLDGGQRSHGFGVAVDARWLGSPELEHVARQALARHGRTAVVSDARFLGVALLADRGARVLETFVLEIMAIAALGLASSHVRLVARRQAVLLPRRGNEFGGNARRAVRPKSHERRSAGGDENHRRGQSPEDASGDAGHRPTP